MLWLERKLASHVVSSWFVGTSHEKSKSQKSRSTNVEILYKWTCRHERRCRHLEQPPESDSSAPAETNHFLVIAVRMAASFRFLLFPLSWYSRCERDASLSGLLYSECLVRPTLCIHLSRRNMQVRTYLQIVKFFFVSCISNYSGSFYYTKQQFPSQTDIMKLYFTFFLVNYILLCESRTCQLAAPIALAQHDKFCFKSLSTVLEGSISCPWRFSWSLISIPSLSFFVGPLGVDGYCCAWSHSVTHIRTR